MTREEQLSHAWQRTSAEVAESCRRHGRPPGDVTIIAVTKGFPGTDLISLSRIGVTDIGESRDSEARVKLAEVDASGCQELRWHAIGQVQTNKARHVAEWADLVHSVDRQRLVDALSSAVVAPRRLNVLVQIRPGRAVASGDGRAGADLEDYQSIVDAIIAAPGLNLRGVMTVAEPDRPARLQFEQVAAAWHAIRRAHPDATIFSAGMSGDFEDAIAAGATHLRIGTAILGRRA